MLNAYTITFGARNVRQLMHAIVSREPKKEEEKNITHSFSRSCQSLTETVFVSASLRSVDRSYVMCGAARTRAVYAVEMAWRRFCCCLVSGLVRLGLVPRAHAFEVKTLNSSPPQCSFYVAIVNCV